MIAAAGDRIRAAVAAADARGAGAAGADLPGGHRPRRLGPRRQRQCVEDRPDAVGRAGLRLVRDRLFRRHLPAGRALPRPCGAARLPPRGGVPVFPVLGHPDRPDLRLHRPGGGGASRDRIRQGRLSGGRIPRCWRPSPNAPSSNWARCRRRTARSASTGCRCWASRPMWARRRKAITTMSRARAPARRDSNVADCALCDDFCTGLCRLQPVQPHGHVSHLGPVAAGALHDHGDGQLHWHPPGHDHDHHHPVYPHAKHPLGPESARKSRR